MDVATVAFLIGYACFAFIVAYYAMKIYAGRR